MFTDDGARRGAICDGYAEGPRLGADLASSCRRCRARARPGARAITLELDLVGASETRFVEFRTGPNRAVHPLPELGPGRHRLHLALPGPVPEAVMTARLVSGTGARARADEVLVVRK